MRFLLMAVGVCGIVSLGGCEAYRPLTARGQEICVGSIEAHNGSTVKEALLKIAPITRDCADKQKFYIKIEDTRTVLDYNNLSISNLYRRSYHVKVIRGTEVYPFEYTTSYKDVGTNYFAQTMTERSNDENDAGMLAQKIYQTIVTAPERGEK